ncbi:MAG: chemotaxis protein [Paucimonas sp.]|jgi:hypothetical protein|nr:chemotaxis protein [Paucimonas sp.]
MTTREKQLAAQIKGLLSGLSDQGAQHLTEVETDLTQTTFLLGEAIEKLGASFMAIHDSLCAHQAIVDSVIAQLPMSGENEEKLKAVQSDIARHVNSAVTGLQFQDMTSQLIARTLRRVNGLRDLLAAVGLHTVSMVPEGDEEKFLEQLRLIGQLMEDQSTKLDSALWKSVSQTRMESGDVELF